MDEWLVNPLLIPTNIQKTIYNGFIPSGTKHYRFCIIMPENHMLSGATIKCDWALERVLRPHVNVITQRLQECSSLAAFLSELQQIIERCSAVGSLMDTSGASTSSFCGSLVSELEQLGWDKLDTVDANFKQLKLKYLDRRKRCHCLTVILHDQHPSVGPTCYTELPSRFDFTWTKQSTLTDVYKEFCSAADRFEDFWTMMEEIDKDTWILEPEQVTYNTTFRRVAVKKNASIYINVNPLHPRQLPDCRFLGADQVIKDIQENFNKNLHSWNPEESLLCNLQNMLDITFPSPSMSRKEDYSVECGICYSYRLESEIPENACDDPRCGQPYHQTCLYEWLRGLSTSRQSFNVIFGECPYCNKPITVKMCKTR